MRKSNCSTCRAYDPIDYKIAEDTIFEPDILIVCGKIAGSFLDFPPALIPEILSKSTEEKDRGIKFEYYQQEGVRYYLIVDVKKKKMEIFELFSGVYHLQTLENELEFRVAENCIVKPQLTAIWD